MDLYSFVLRGDLTNQTLESTGLLARRSAIVEGQEEFTAALALDLLDAADLASAKIMGSVFVAITAFERGARSFIRSVLLEEFGEEWWTKGASGKIQTFAESRRNEEAKAKWHGERGDDPLDYTELGHLPQIIQQNWQLFEPHIPRIDWATAIFSGIERSRNVIMHGGELSIEDAERVGMNIRDWFRQVGA